MADPIEIHNTIFGLDNIKTDSKADLKASLKLEQPFETKGTNVLELKLPQPFETKATNVIDLKPIEIKPLDFKLEPIKTDSSLSLDLKPAVIDFCFTTNVGKLPNVCIRQPYHHHIGFTLFGTEVWGYTFSGQQETVVEEIDRQPKVAWGRAMITWPPSRPASAPSQPPSRTVGGLRVRLDP